MTCLFANSLAGRSVHVGATSVLSVGAVLRGFGAGRPWKEAVLVS